ncbi:hypothetical protein ACMFMF_007638 [Clarireedia jacksonii]
MSRTLARRALAQSPFSTSPRKADGDDISSFRSSTMRFTSPQTDRKDTRDASPQSKPRPAANASSMTELAGMFAKLSASTPTQRGFKKTKVFESSYSDDDGTLIGDTKVDEEPHHFHVYATRHNTHITLTRPDRSPIISLSCGNIGFRHSGRKHYDSAFQLASLVMARIHERAINREIHKLELVLRGFGAGREAVTKALMGTEGRLLRGKVVKVTDATRLKFGGTRSKKPRRLG